MIIIILTIIIIIIIIISSEELASLEFDYGNLLNCWTLRGYWNGFTLLELLPTIHWEMMKKVVPRVGG